MATNSTKTCKSCKFWVKETSWCLRKSHFSKAETPLCPLSTIKIIAPVQNKEEK